MSDLISRQAVIEICEWYQREFCELDDVLDDLIDEIRDLPAAESVDRHLRTMIGETLVSESKRHISAETAIINIRRYMQEADFKRAKVEVEDE